MSKAEGALTCEHTQYGGLGLGGKELEDGEHAAGADVVAVNEAQRVRNGVPHAVNARTRPPMGDEPIGERHLHEVRKEVGKGFNGR